MDACSITQLPVWYNTWNIACRHIIEIAKINWGKVMTSSNKLLRIRKINDYGTYLKNWNGYELFFSSKRKSVSAI